MANPQVKNGYTTIANEIIEAVAGFDFSKRELKILLIVIRETYGYQRKSKEILRELLVKKTGIDVAHVSRTISALASKNVLFREKSELGINKDYEQWKLAETANSNRLKQPIEKESRVVQNSQEKLAETANSNRLKQPIPFNNVLKKPLKKKENNAHARVDSGSQNLKQPRKKAPDAIDALPDKPEGFDLIDRFVKYRKEIGKPFKSIDSIKTFHRKLGDAARDYNHAKELIETSIANGWQGVIFNKKF